MLFSINTSKPQLSRKEVSLRKTKAIDTTAFMEDLSASRLCWDPPFQPDELVDCYNTTFAELLDRYAPLKTKTVTVRPQVPWYSDEIREAKREHRRAERRWRSTGTAADLDSFKKHKNYVTRLLKEAKSAFLAEFIDQNADHQGTLFRAVKDLLVEKNPGGVLPYMGYIGMCGPKGYGFSAVLVINRVSILADFGHFGHK